MKNYGINSACTAAEKTTGSEVLRQRCRPEVPADRSACTAAAGLLRLLASPLRLKIVYELCDGNLSAAELAARLQPTPQVKLSLHLVALCGAGVISRWQWQGQTCYSVQGHLAEGLCRAALDGLPADPDGGRNC